MAAYITAEIPRSSKNSWVLRASFVASSCVSPPPQYDAQRRGFPRKTRTTSCAARPCGTPYGQGEGAKEEEPRMLDHVSLGVSDIERSRRFYDAALRPLALVRIVDFGSGRGSDYGAAPGSLGVEFTITAETSVAAPYPGIHLCFRAPGREAVHAFHAAALGAGGRDDGAPGPRPHYHADYYAAFVLDPDGHRIEAVSHAPTKSTLVE